MVRKGGEKSKVAPVWSFVGPVLKSFELWKARIEADGTVGERGERACVDLNFEFNFVFGCDSASPGSRRKRESICFGGGVRW